jgi:transcriptional regulator with XRE-family HTH domain
MWTASILRNARRHAGLSQRELAARAGVPHSTVGRIEAGLIDPRASTLRALLAACDIDLEAMPLLGRGVDRSQIRERLRLTPAKRIADLAAAAAAVRRIHGRARGGT